MIRVFVISAITLYRDGLADLLRRGQNVEVVGTAAQPVRAVEEIRASTVTPDVVLFDMSSSDGIHAIRLLVSEIFGPRLLAITVPDREHDVIACAEAGASGFVTRDASLDDLVKAIEGVARGEVLCSPSMTAALLRRVATLALDRTRPEPREFLTMREREIVALIDEGLSNKQIAQRLYIEVPTVKNHVHRILGKLGVNRRAEAAALMRGIHS